MNGAFRCAGAEMSNGLHFLEPESCTEKMQNDSQVSRTSPAELQAPEVSSDEETSNRPEMGNLFSKSWGIRAAATHRIKVP